MLAERDEEGVGGKTKEREEEEPRKQDIRAGNSGEDGVYRGGVGGREEEEEEEKVSSINMSMSASTQSTVLATICVVDSSLAVAIEWVKIFPDYLAPIIQRLAELTSNANQVRSRRDPAPSPLTFLSSGSGLLHMASHPLALRPSSVSVSSSHRLR